jgi:hypothetical protein
MRAGSYRLACLGGADDRSPCLVSVGATGIPLMSACTLADMAAQNPIIIHGMTHIILNLPE